jgi:hypothetical protein
MLDPYTSTTIISPSAASPALRLVMHHLRCWLPLLNGSERYVTLTTAGDFH